MKAATAERDDLVTELRSIAYNASAMEQSYAFAKIPALDEQEQHSGIFPAAGNMQLGPRPGLEDPPASALV